MPVVIRKRPAADGTWYEVEDFRAYVEELSRKGIETPKAKYRIFISAETARGLAATCSDLEPQIALFFRLGPASGIDYQMIGLPMG